MDQIRDHPDAVLEYLVEVHGEEAVRRLLERKRDE